MSSDLIEGKYFVFVKLLQYGTCCSVSREPNSKSVGLTCSCRTQKAKTSP